ncbi:hypothetical protein VMCG_04775 [Cytospora schulzeri]|uniref:Extracellular membrane protein CFEM domain-containing protein n=1 Tax=Cytospora schulzeri TaxID=448051 RepID=A0A423WMV4_9PEZI|nr:hypothetical protein VMCG_04775 [Valsa malicola]
MRLSSITELSATALAILANPVMATPYHLNTCLSQVAADVSCVDAMVLSYCLAITMEDTTLLALSLLEVGCTLDEARETTLAVEQCLTESDEGLNDSESGPDDLRRRNLDQPRQPIQIRGTKWARYSSSSPGFNVAVSSAIVGLVLGLSAFVSMVVICFCCLRESSRKKKARAAAEAKEALKVKGRK